jgi:hypothetical protein
MFAVPDRALYRFVPGCFLQFYGVRPF